tara:strand:+ start:1295 stop:1684 length:390 start_codon:yes stop_codon:yes gene_type:complete
MAKWTVGESKELNELLPNGEYLGRVVKAEISIQQNGKTAGAEKLTLTWNVDGRTLVQDALIFHEAMAWKLNQFISATGMGKVGDAIEIDDKNVLDKSCILNIIQKEVPKRDGSGNVKVNNILKYAAEAF